MESTNTSTFLTEKGVLYYDLDAVVVLDAGGDLRSAVVIALSPGTVRDADEVGLQCAERAQLPVDGFDGMVPFRREDFEREDRPPGVVRVSCFEQFLYHTSF